MARTAIVTKSRKFMERHIRALRKAREVHDNRKDRKKLRIKYSARATNRCSIVNCGRVHGYLRDFGVCRCCFRELAEKGLVPGLRKASW